MKSIDNLIKGNYYTAITHNGDRYIFRYDGGDLTGKLPPYMRGSSFYMTGTGSINIPGNSGFVRYEPATFKEEEHLKQCISAGQYVSYDITKNNPPYEIY
jgi:hypothetical protein